MYTKYSINLEQERFDLRSLSPALYNLWSLPVRPFFWLAGKKTDRLPVGHSLTICLYFDRL